MIIVFWSDLCISILEFKFDTVETMKAVSSFYLCISILEFKFF